MQKNGRFRHGMLIYRKKRSIVWTYLLILKGEKDMQEINTTNTTGEYQKEVDITEEEIESYSGCSERTQRCLTDCPWPFPGSYLNAAK